jgi:hypothetical protein
MDELIRVRGHRDHNNIVIKGQYHEIFDPQFFSLFMTYSGLEYRFEFAEKFESILKTALANESGELEMPFNEKTRVENLVILSL